MGSIDLSDDLLNNFEEAIKNLVAFHLQDPSTGSSSAVASVSNIENNTAATEQHVRRIHQCANEIEINLLQLKALVHRVLPEEQILENIAELRTAIDRKEILLREFDQYLNDAITDFSVENTESLNGLLDKLSQGTGLSSVLGPIDSTEGLLPSASNTQPCKSNEKKNNDHPIVHSFSVFFSASVLRFNTDSSIDARFWTRFVTFFLVNFTLKTDLLLKKKNRNRRCSVSFRC